MEHLERLAVHLREAERLTGSTNISELRVALILLDSAAELQMYRQVESELSSTRIYSDLVRLFEIQVNAGLPLTDEDKSNLADYKARLVSNTRRKKLDRDFSEKALYLSERDYFSPAEVRVLNKLHDYRNATYHRDTLRPETVKSAAHIYLWLNCQMLLRFRPIAYQVLSPPWPETLAPFFEGRQTNTMTSGFAEVANTILDRSGLLVDTAPTSYLSRHALDRIENLKEGIEECADSINSLAGTDDWDFESFLIEIQLPEPGRHLPLTSTERKNIRVAISRETFEGWRDRAEQLGSEADPVASFSKFADLEDEFEGIENSVQLWLIRIDGEIQNRIDWARGK